MNIVYPEEYIYPVNMSEIDKFDFVNVNQEQNEYRHTEVKNEYRYKEFVINKHDNIFDNIDDEYCNSI